MRDSMDGMYHDNFYFNDPVDYMSNRGFPIGGDRRQHRSQRDVSWQAWNRAQRRISNYNAGSAIPTRGLSVGVEVGVGVGVASGFSRSTNPWLTPAASL